MRISQNPVDFMRISQNPVDFMRISQNPADFVKSGRFHADFTKSARFHEIRRISKDQLPGMVRPMFHTVLILRLCNSIKKCFRL